MAVGPALVRRPQLGRVLIKSGQMSASARKQRDYRAAAKRREEPEADMGPFAWERTWTRRLMNRAAHGPCSRNQGNGAVTFYREIGTYAVTQLHTAALRK